MRATSSFLYALAGLVALLAIHLLIPRIVAVDESERGDGLLAAH